MDELQQLEDWLAPLLADMAPAARSRLARRIGTALRQHESKRIARQANPDGSPYVPRKVPLRARTGRIKRGVMFAKLRQARHLKVRANPNEVTVGFLGRVAHIARVHQEGRMDSVRPGGPRVRYEQRKLLGFSPHSRELIRDLLLDHFGDV
ncbi:phage virion morphogenesis protein [Pseudoxanthomonas wuyuanensis]|uniref:Phage virion morphogenesis (Putative tail completion) protein n=1 Tax=Pseudoxanthomonas wuyuanensis TaxID=1073196 RepID=A0A286D4T4_9GAMM|nr:phage virion morphogenesis protein [Pseudoxanthomonas wuyuanensis]KAF1719806.1 phage virion morphogenesis protein [Pseudoxanthomonas wuyuanensis]SOD53677.1 phage virion morphogenesis (putative tail completion) protein [Pseudoxanthomonas wuyuanensis]